MVRTAWTSSRAPNLGFSLAWGGNDIVDRGNMLACSSRLTGIACISAFFLGYQKKEEAASIYLYAWALMMALTLYVMIELDRPRRGSITIDQSEQKIEDLRNLLEE